MKKENKNRLFAFQKDEAVNCGGCNWGASILFVVANTRNRAETMLCMGEAGMCGECMCEMLAEIKAVIS